MQAMLVEAQVEGNVAGGLRAIEWDEGLGSCKETHEIIEQIPRKEPLSPAFVTQKIAAYGKTFAQGGAIVEKSGSFILYAPDSKTPLRGTCFGDSGAPAFPDLQTPTVLGIVTGGPRLCAGAVSFGVSLPAGMDGLTQ